LQRQVLFGTFSLGQNKAIAAKQRLEDLNDTIKIQAYPFKLDYQNALDLFNEYDIIIDGTDNFETRYLVNDACIITNKPLVFGAIYKFQGQVSVFNYQHGPSYRCLFPNPPQKDSIPNCSDIGVLGVLPGIIGSMQANEVLKIILGIGDVLSGKLLCFNALTNHTSTIKIKKSEETINAVLKHKSNFHDNQLNLNCETEVYETSIKHILNKENIQFMDVREPHEMPKIEDLDVIEIPLSELKHHLHKIDSNKQKAIFCQSGMRSKKAVLVLNKLGINDCLSIIEGALEIKEIIKTKPVKL
jgi:adenylyltransferase/sulfurtransferase